MATHTDFYWVAQACRQTTDLSQTDWQEGYPIVDLEQLIAMKHTAFRLKDRVHLLDMIDVGIITPATRAGLPASLKPRLQELLDNPEA